MATGIPNYDDTLLCFLYANNNEQFQVKSWKAVQPQQPY